MSHLYSAT